MWAIKGNVPLEISEGELVQEGSTAYVILKAMFKPDASDYTEGPKEDESKLINQAEIDGAQNAYLSQEIQGALMFRIPNARNLTSFSGSKNSKNTPKVIVSCGESNAASKAVEGTSPDWGFEGSISIQAKRKTDMDVNIQIETEGKFVGKYTIPLADFTKAPNSWLLNGYYDLTEKNENLQKGQKKVSLGRVYIQMKWVPDGYEGAKTYPCYIMDFEKNKDKPE